MKKRNKVLAIALAVATLIPSSVGAASIIKDYTGYKVKPSYSVQRVTTGGEGQKFFTSILKGNYVCQVRIIPQKNNTVNKDNPVAKEEKKDTAPTTPSKEVQKETPAPTAPSKEVQKETPAPTRQSNKEEQGNAGQNSQLNVLEQEVIKLTNEERAKNGLAPLKANVELSLVARAKSQDMIDKNYFDHQSPTYGSPFDMMKSFGISYRTAGENIAKGQRTAQQVVNGWMNSEGHRKNILNGNFTEIGVGYAVDQNGTPHWTQMFIG